MPRIERQDVYKRQDLGYLTQMGKGGDLEELLDALLSDHYEIQERMMLSGRVYHEGKPAASRIALNDICLLYTSFPMGILFFASVYIKVL